MHRSQWPPGFEIKDVCLAPESCVYQDFSLEVETDRTKHLANETL